VVTIFIVVFGFVLAAEGYQDTLTESIWLSMIHVMDKSLLKNNQTNALQRATLSFMTIFGIFMAGTLLATLNKGFDVEFNRMAKGRSKIAEHDPHILILGFSDMTLSIIRELAKVNATNHKKTPVVVADKEPDTFEMMKQIDALGIKNSKLRMICREGEIFNFATLDLCSIESAHVVIICGKDDFETVKAIMACNVRLNQLGKVVGPNATPVIAVIRNDKRRKEAELAGGPNLHVISYGRMIGRIISTVSHGSGLSFIYRKFLASRGQSLSRVDVSELGVEPDSWTSRLPKFQINQYLSEGIVLGGVGTGRDSYLMPADNKQVAGDYSEFFVLHDVQAMPRLLPQENVPKKTVTLPTELPEEVVANSKSRLLILGTGHLLEDVLGNENRRLQRFSQVIIGCDKRAKGVDVKDLVKRFPYLTIEVRTCDLYDYDELQELVESTQAKSVIVLSDHEKEARKADERLLTRLVYLQNIKDRLGSKNPDFDMTCEVRLENTKDVAALTGTNDYIVGDAFVSMAVARLAEDPRSYELIHELLTAESGVTITMQYVAEYLDFGGMPTATTDLLTLGKAVASKGGVLLGLHRLAMDKNTGVLEYQLPELNPARWNNGEPEQYMFWVEDELVVLTANEKPIED